MSVLRVRFFGKIGNTKTDDYLKYPYSERIDQIIFKFRSELGDLESGCFFLKGFEKST